MSQAEITPQTKLAFTFETMAVFPTTAWGRVGLDCVSRYIELNERYFNDELPPVPIVIVPLLPGNHHADCNGKLIRIVASDDATSIDSRALLHEMVHLKLLTLGKDSSHGSPDWNLEVTRLKKIMSTERWPFGT